MGKYSSTKEEQGIRKLCHLLETPQEPELKGLARKAKPGQARGNTRLTRDQHSIAMEQPLKPWSFQIMKTQEIKNLHNRLGATQFGHGQFPMTTISTATHVMATSECAEDLARANWKAAFISLREFRILWLGWSQIAESTDTWLWQSAACLVCLSLQMFAADLSGCTPLNLFDIYIRLYTNTVSVKRVCLGAVTICQRLEFLWTLSLWFARKHHKWWGLGLGPFEDKLVGHVQSMRAKGKIAEKQLKLELGKA